MKEDDQVHIHIFDAKAVQHDITVRQLEVRLQ